MTFQENAKDPKDLVHINCTLLNEQVYETIGEKYGYKNSIWYSDYERKLFHKNKVTGILTKIIM